MLLSPTSFLVLQRAGLAAVPGLREQAVTNRDPPHDLCFVAFVTVRKREADLCLHVGDLPAGRVVPVAPGNMSRGGLGGCLEADGIPLTHEGLQGTAARMIRADTLGNRNGSDQREAHASDQDWTHDHSPWLRFHLAARFSPPTAGSASERTVRSFTKA